MYFFEEFIRDKKHAGSKARKDIQEIFLEQNLKSTTRKDFYKEKSLINLGESVRERFFLLQSWLMMCNVKNEVIFIQYPILKWKKKISIEMLFKMLNAE